jgi:hypothetical protein
VASLWGSGGRRVVRGDGRVLPGRRGSAAGPARRPLAGGDRGRARLAAAVRRQAGPGGAAPVPGVRGRVALDGPALGRGRGHGTGRAGEGAAGAAGRLGPGHAPVSGRGGGRGRDPRCRRRGDRLHGSGSVGHLRRSGPGPERDILRRPQLRARRGGSSGGRPGRAGHRRPAGLRGPGRGRPSGRAALGLARRQPAGHDRRQPAAVGAAARPLRRSAAATGGVAREPRPHLGRAHTTPRLDIARRLRRRGVPLLARGREHSSHLLRGAGVGALGSAPGAARGPFGAW